MRTQFLKITTAVLMSLLFVAPAWSDPGQDGAAGENRRAEMLEKIRIVRMYSLTEALELDEATAAKLFPYLRKHDGTLETLQQNKHKSHRALRKMVKDGNFDEAAAERHFAVILEADIEIAKTERLQLEGLKDILSTEQRVKFVTAKPSFERKIREIIREERRRRRGKQGERGQRGERGGGHMGGPPPGR